MLRGAGMLTAGDAASVAASLERFHLLWFDEPCPVTNLRTIRKIAEESVTPLGFGMACANPRCFRTCCVRDSSTSSARSSDGRHQPNTPDRHNGGDLLCGRAPRHEGGPIATAAALHLAASLPNFFIQHIPLPSDERDRRMRLELISQPVETVMDGFAALPRGIGVGNRSQRKRSRKIQGGCGMKRRHFLSGVLAGGALARKARGSRFLRMFTCSAQASAAASSDEAAWQPVQFRREGHGNEGLRRLADAQFRPSVRLREARNQQGRGGLG